MMAVGDAGLEARRIAGSQQSLATVLDQRQLAFEDVDEFVLLLMPMAQRRGGAGLEPGEVDTELGEPGDVAECRLLAALGDGAQGHGIAAAGAHGRRGDVDLGHSPSLNPGSARPTCERSAGRWYRVPS